MRRLRVVLLAILCTAVLMPAVTHAESAAETTYKKALPICSEITKKIDAVARFTPTYCGPATSKAGVLSFGIVAAKPVLSVVASRRTWLLATIDAVGYALNKRPSVTVDELALSDDTMMTKRINYLFPASLAKSLQRQFVNKQIDTEALYAAIEKNLVEESFAKK